MKYKDWSGKNQNGVLGSITKFSAHAWTIARHVAGFGSQFYRTFTKEDSPLLKYHENTSNVLGQIKNSHSCGLLDGFFEN